MRKPIIFSITDIAKIIQARQENEFDSNIGICGDRGDGKSTLGSKIFYKIKRFNPWTHQVYSQDNVIKLLRSQVKGKCFDDEAINSGYKRDFQDRGQKQLIKILTNYRDNFNTYVGALPNFFSLDKDLRDLIFMVLHVIERGLAVVHLPLQGRMYSQDRWDAKNNAKIEQAWHNKLKQNLNFKIPYHKLSTFAGYLYFTDLFPKQKELYKEVKRVKRAGAHSDSAEEAKEETLKERIYKALTEGKLTQEGLMQFCLMHGKKYSSVCSTLNIMLKDRGTGKTMKQYFSEKQKENAINGVNQVTDLVPDLSA
jgi:hypothetical protein